MDVTTQLTRDVPNSSLEPIPELCCAAMWRGRATRGWMYSTSFPSWVTWNDTQFLNERFDNLLTEATGSPDQGKRQNLHREMAAIVRDEGGTIVPMFNQFIDAISDQIGRYVGRVDSPVNGYALMQCWLKA
ncbi:Extracellular solute-binding protein family 5 (fragment) [Mesorhizobium prunaredense]|uniref:Extracellular solute-binding protein family 5 n=1 Tax=Mesorhizobium prunaredense TaxID=1631249 RepID=A0A1R3V862_9HYPH